MDEIQYSTMIVSNAHPYASPAPAVWPFDASELTSGIVPSIRFRAAA